jgi:hypothetical protein
MFTKCDAKTQMWSYEKRQNHSSLVLGRFLARYSPAVWSLTQAAAMPDAKLCNAAV